MKQLMVELLYPACKLVSNGNQKSADWKPGNEHKCDLYRIPQDQNTKSQ